MGLDLTDFSEVAFENLNRRRFVLFCGAANQIFALERTKNLAECRLFLEALRFFNFKLNALSRALHYSFKFTDRLVSGRGVDDWLEVRLRVVGPVDSDAVTCVVL